MAETFPFHHEINELIRFNSNNYKYPKKRAFLAPLISFAIDALDKIRFESLTDKSKLGAQPELFIRIIPDKANNTLTVVDSGIGMTKADLVKNLGSVEWSAPRDVRFYWAYLVAEKVTVTTKHNDDEQYVWESQGDGYFTVTRDNSGENFGRGTKITLFLKQDQLQFLEKRRLKNLIKKHSWFINYPVSLWIEKTTEMEISDDEEGKLDVVDEEQEKKMEWSLVNEEELIWKEQYAEKHFFVNGPLEIDALLYVPKKANFDKRYYVNLYIHGDLIMENSQEFIPGYMGFVNGRVDIMSSPFNIYREGFNRDKIVTVVRKILVEKSFELLYEIAEIKEDYKKFYEAFSRRLKFGILLDPMNQIKIVELLRYHSTKSGDEMTSLKDYVTKMKKGQNDIYYIIGESKKAVENSPFLGKFKKKGYEVLFMVDKPDKLVVCRLKEYERKKFVSVAKEDLELDESEDEKERKDELKKKLDGLCKLMKDVLGDEVEDVVVSDSFDHSPCCLVTGEHGVSGKKIMMINPENPFMERLRNLAEADTNPESIKKLVLNLFDCACFTCQLEKKAWDVVKSNEGESASTIAVTGSLRQRKNKGKAQF